MNKISNKIRVRQKNLRKKNRGKKEISLILGMIIIFRIVLKRNILFKVR